MYTHYNPLFSQALRTTGLLASIPFLVSCAFAPWENTITKSAQTEENIAKVEKRLEDHPESTKLLKDLLVVKENVTQNLLLLAEKSRLNGQNENAKKFYDRVLTYDPKNQAAIFGLNQLKSELLETKTLEKAYGMIANHQEKEASPFIHEALLENPNSQKANELNNKILSVNGKVNNQPPKLKANSSKPVNLELRDANIKVVFEALSRATGINFILDKDVRPDTKATVFVKKLPIEDAIDMVLSSNGLQKKVLNENTALIFPSNPQKLKDYQELMIRSFYLNNTSAKQVAAMLKSMLKINDMFIDERLNMIVIRDTPEVIRIAEKLVKGNDIEDAEVMLEIEVLEVSRSRLQELGINYPTQLSVTGTTLESLKHINSTLINLTPNPSINFRKTTGDVNLLSNPRIRVKNNEKAKVLVGDKVPIITSSAVNGLLTENVNYIDVGLKLDVQPRIALDDYVNIKVDLEVSSLGDKVTSGNTIAYTIGTRNANTVLRLKDGETQVLAGLIQDDERKNASKLPGLGDIPLLGRLFSDQTNQKTKTEIVLAITPHVISNLKLPSAEVSEYWSGTQNVITDKPSSAIPTAGGQALSPREQAAENMREQRELRSLLNNEKPNQEMVPQAAPIPNGFSDSLNPYAPEQPTKIIPPADMAPAPAEPENALPDANL
jgi:general secretion pathway protein D